MVTKIQAAFAFFLLAFTIFPPRGVSGTVLDSDATLRGLKGIKVVVENISPEIQAGGLNPNQIRSDIELRLNKAGIKVLTDPEYERDLPYLAVSFSALKEKKLNLYGYHIAVEVFQLMTLNRDKEISAFSATWSTGSTGMVGSEDFGKYVREKIAGAVDRFIEAYLAVNPRGPLTP